MLLPHKKTYIHLVLAVSMLLVLLAAWWWLDGQINLAGEELATLRGQVEKNLISESDSLTLQKKLTQTTEDRLLLDQAVITNETVDVLLTKLEAVATESGFNLNITKVTADKGLVITLSGEGTFKQWFKFLQLALTLDYGLMVDDLTLSSPTVETVGDGWSGTLKLTVNNFVANYEK